MMNEKKLFLNFFREKWKRKFPVQNLTSENILHSKLQKGEGSFIMTTISSYIFQCRTERLKNRFIPKWITTF